MTICKEHKDIIEKIQKLNGRSLVMNKEIEYLTEKTDKLEKDMESMKTEIKQLSDKISGMAAKIILGTSLLITAINNILAYLGGNH